MQKTTRGLLGGRICLVGLALALLSASCSNGSSATTESTTTTTTTDHGATGAPSSSVTVGGVTGGQRMGSSQHSAYVVHSNGVAATTPSSENYRMTDPALESAIDAD